MDVAYGSDRHTVWSRRSARFDPARVGVYGLAMAVAYLAGVYLGGVLLVVWYALLLLPIFSILQAMRTARSVYVREEYGNEQPSKGESVAYRLSVRNESRLPSAPVLITLYRGLERRGLEHRTIHLWPRESRKIDQTVDCPYRGIYTVGIARLEIRDVFGLVRFGLHASCRSFLIYPRVLHLPGAPAGFQAEGALAESPTVGGEVDFALLRGLRVYQPGDDARHVSWRTVALIGEPRIREYDSAAEPAVTICMDTRPVDGTGDTVLETEDCVIEVAIALAGYYLRNDIPVAMIVASRVFRLEPGDEQSFSRFHETTVSLRFESSVPPASTYDYHRSDPAFVDGAVVFVTHTLDPGVIDYVERGSAHMSRAAAVLTASALAPGERAAATERRHAHDGNTVLLTVDSADALIEEFTRWHSEHS